VTTFLLIRHGDTDALGEVLAGWRPGWHLNSAGREQVTQIAQKLARFAIRAVYTSPLERARETALAIAEPHGIAPIVREQLGEMRFGRWEGQTFEQLSKDAEWHRFNAMRSTVRPPNGELLVEVQTRTVRETEEIRCRHAGETVAIVSHADPLRALVAYWLGCPLDLLLRFSISPASITAVRFFEDVPTILCLNHTDVVSV